MHWKMVLKLLTDYSVDNASENAAPISCIYRRILPSEIIGGSFRQKLLNHAVGNYRRIMLSVINERHYLSVNISYDPFIDGFQPIENP